MCCYEFSFRIQLSVIYDYVVKRISFKFGKCSLDIVFQSVDSLGKLATMSGTASGFL